MANQKRNHFFKYAILLFSNTTFANLPICVKYPFPKIWSSFRFYSGIDLEGNTNRPAPVGSQHRLVSSSPFASLDSRSAARLCSSSDGTQKYSFTSSSRRTPSIPRSQPAIKAKSLGSDGYAPGNPLAGKSSGILKYSSQLLTKSEVSIVLR